MDEQNQNGQDQFSNFIDELIGGRANGMDPDTLAEMKKSIAAEVDDALNRAVLARLPDEALEEIENYVDTNEDQEGLAALILEKASEANLDLNVITMDTLLQFKALYTGEVLADDLDEDIDSLEDEEVESTSEEGEA